MTVVFTEKLDVTLTYTVICGAVTAGQSCFSVTTQLLCAGAYPVADSKNRVFADTVLVNSETVTFKVTKGLADSVLMDDSTYFFAVHKVLTDTVTMAESFMPTTQWGRTYSDSITVSENLGKTFKPADPAESITVPESVAKLVKKVFADNIVLTETFSNGRTQTPNDSVLTADTGVLLNQGYFDHTGNPNGYFADDYFGDKRTW